MELALYDNPYGYYMTQAAEAEGSVSDRIGWRGDFFTAPELSPILATTLVRQILDVDVQLGHPDPFTFIEIGGGNGTFAADFLQECQKTASDFFHRLSYHIVERSPYLQARQANSLRNIIGNWAERHLAWKSSLDEITPDSVVGAIFSNELVDALPVHRVRWEHKHLSEVCVTYEGGRFVEFLDHRSSSRLAEYLDTHRISLSEGQLTELHLEAEAWMQKVARLLHRGVVMTVDYGHTGKDYYRADRKDGTLLCYYRHTISPNPYIRVGEQDITAHVNFSALAGSGNALGLQMAGFTTLANWLMGLGVDEWVKDRDQESEEVKALAQLLRPGGMGKTFKVLVQQKALEHFFFQGLRYPAFFEDVLASG